MHKKRRQRAGSGAELTAARKIPSLRVSSELSADGKPVRRGADLEAAMESRCLILDTLMARACEIEGAMARLVEQERGPQH